MLTLLGYLPFAGTLGDRFIRPLLVYPSLIGTFQVRPLPFSLGNAPTRGQALFVFVMLVLNVVTTATGQQRKIELGNAVATLVVSRWENQLDLQQARARLGVANTRDPAAAEALSSAGGMPPGSG